ncbi:MAG: YdeI/OmpD-associated family protein [Marinilabiliaceae bacterium]|jgi:uncharacterized protein YdeI (YjbR/CyaY-like superfamily)|nr:YdeI/OmpD-associated family protein [Marinilabiliaceae bacterium]
MRVDEIKYFRNRQEWREWLRNNHNSSNEIWLLYYKKHTCRPRIPYDDAVEEALCFGWIDSIVKKVDEISYCQRFTPRKQGSSWSESNIHRAERMIAAGKMMPAGMERYSELMEKPELALETPDNSLDLELPLSLVNALKTNKVARDFFLVQPRSYRNMCIRWIEAAKREETRQRRVGEVVRKSNNKERIGLK